MPARLPVSHARAAQLLPDPALGLRPTRGSGLDTQEPPHKAAGSHCRLLPISRPRGASFPRVHKLLVHVGLEPRATGLLTPRWGLTSFSVNPNHLRSRCRFLGLPPWSEPKDWAGPGICIHQTHLLPQTSSLSAPGGGWEAPRLPGDSARVASPGRFVESGLRGVGRTRRESPRRQQLRPRTQVCWLHLLGLLQGCPGLEAEERLLCC